MNNDGTYFPRLTASYSSPKTPISKLNDGNYWYLQHPPNRWTCEGSPNDRDWVVVDFGTPRPIHTVKLYVLDDDGEQRSVVRVTSSGSKSEAWHDGVWQSIPSTEASRIKPTGHRPAVVQFDPLEDKQAASHIAAPARCAKSGLTEIEAWGDVQSATRTRSAASRQSGLQSWRRK